MSGKHHHKKNDHDHHRRRHGHHQLGTVPEATARLRKNGPCHIGDMGITATRGSEAVEAAGEEIRRCGQPLDNPLAEGTHRLVGSQADADAELATAAPSTSERVRPYGCQR